MRPNPWVAPGADDGLAVEGAGGAGVEGASSRGGWAAGGVAVRRSWASPARRSATWRGVSRTGRPANQSRAGPVQSVRVAAATRAPKRPPVKGAVSRSGTATTESATRAPRWRWST